MLFRSELVAADQFKSYDELKKRLNYVLGSKSSSRIDEEVENEEEYTRGSTRELPDDLREEINNLHPPRRVSTPAVEEDEDDDALSYFARLAEE